MWSNDRAGGCWLLTNTLSRPFFTSAVRTEGEGAHRAHPLRGCKIRSGPPPWGALPCLPLPSRHDTKLGPFSGRAANRADRAKRSPGTGLPGLCGRTGAAWGIAAPFPSRPGRKGPRKRECIWRRTTAEPPGWRSLGMCRRGVGKAEAEQQRPEQDRSMDVHPERAQRMALVKQEE